MATGVCALLCACVGACAAFNLDWRFPLLKTGTNGSLFGLSVALHPDLGTGTYRLLVGAPTERAEPHVPANRTGGVYSCPITTDQSDCSRMALIDPGRTQPEDLFEDMWLGVTVVSQGPPGGRVMACGHRFVKLYGAMGLRHMIGRCYLRGNDLQAEEGGVQWQQQLPCSHLGDVTGEVMCNSGISASITQNQIIIGSPGSYEWQGNVHVSWMNPDVEVDVRRSSLPRTQRRNLYTGYSVTQAPRLLSREADTIITGAPKDSKQDAFGSVLLMLVGTPPPGAPPHGPPPPRGAPPPGPPPHGPPPPGGRLEVWQTLRGRQTGSYFGNALAALDLDQDGWTDLLVGAPFYFQAQAGGAVYVFMNGGGRLDPEPRRVLTGPPGSAFGMAVCAAGDLDQDGFPDFVVGAPFHGSGSVMIWSGSRGGVSVEPSQVVHGSMVSSRFSSFGYSLSGGQDVDQNRHPDLLVGSLDHMVALLRSRPVLQLNKTIKVSPETVDPASCDFCIQVQLCFSSTFRAGGGGANVTVHFTVSADVTSLKPRLRFHDNLQSRLSGVLSVPRNHCETLRAGLQGPVRNKVEPLVFSLNVSLHQKIPKRRNGVQDLRRFPVLSQGPEPSRTQIHFQKACGPDHLCHSNLQMSAHFTHQDQDPLPESGGRQLLLDDGSLKRILLQVTVSNRPTENRTAEEAHRTRLGLRVPPELVYAGVQTQGSSLPVDCSSEDGALLCELGNPFRTNQEVQLLIKFQPSEIRLDTREIQIQLQLSTLSEQPDLPPLTVSMLVEHTLQSSLTLMESPGSAPFSGHVIGESAVKTMEDIGTQVTFTFQVQLHGRPLGDLGNLEVEFDWPMEAANGKWLLYLEEIRLEGTSETHCSPPGNILNPLGLPDCVRGARCVTFVCPLRGLRRSATIRLLSRVWNATLIQDYGGAGGVLVGGRATLRLQTSRRVHMDPQTSEMGVHLYPDPGLQLDSGAPLWLVLVSVLAGVLLLALICLLLWKCGFFRRASSRELYQARTQRAHLRPQPHQGPHQGP